MDQFKYQDTPRLEIFFSCLVFRVYSLCHCGWTLQEFVSQTGWRGITNGHLLVLHEMNMPGYRLLELADNLSKRTDLREWTDFVYVEEQLVWGVGGRLHSGLGKPLEALTPCNWLDSILTEGGNFVWLRM